MGLFGKRKSRATRRAEARAIKARAKLEAKLSAKNEARRIKAAQRAESKALKAQLKARRDSDRAALKVAEAELKVAREGKLLSPTRIRRLLTVSRLLAPILTPVIYRAAMAARGLIDQRRADQLGVPLAQIGRFSGHGARLSARVGGAERSLRMVQEKKPKDVETKQFVSAVTNRLTDLSAAVAAAEHMPAAAPDGPLGDLVAAGWHRGGPDGPARVDLTGGPMTAIGMSHPPRVHRRVGGQRTALTAGIGLLLAALVLTTIANPPAAFAHTAQLSTATPAPAVAATDANDVPTWPFVVGTVAAVAVAALWAVRRGR